MNDPNRTHAAPPDSGGNGFTNVLLLLLVCVCGYPVLQSVTGKQIAAAPPRWQHKIVQFEREETAGFVAALDGLAADGWEYVGPLCNNGMNAHVVAFRRRR
jgi:hypothetical protein